MMGVPKIEVQYKIFSKHQVTFDLSFADKRIPVYGAVLDDSTIILSKQDTIDVHTQLL